MKRKSLINGGVNTLTLEELCLSLKINKNNIIVESYSIKSEYYNNKTKVIEFREQKIILIGHSKMIEYLNYNKAKQYGIDCTFKIIPRSYKTYKLMTIYALDNEKKNIIIAAFLCIKYIDFCFIKSTI